MKHLALIIGVYVLGYTFLPCSYGQPIRKRDRFVVGIDAGVTIRSTLMNAFNFKGVNAYNGVIGFNYEKHIQGISLTTSVSIYDTLTHLGLAYAPSMRYAYVHGTFSEPRYVKDLLTEHHAYIFKVYSLNRRSSRKMYIGVGGALMNPGKRYFISKDLPNGLQRAIQNDFWFDIQYWVGECRVGLPVATHLWVEPMFSVIPRTFPTNKSETFLMYSVRLSYNFSKKPF